MVKGRQYPHNHEDLVTVGGKEVIFRDGYEYVAGEVTVAAEDLDRALEVLDRSLAKRGEVSSESDGSGVAVIEFTANADPLAVVRRLTSAGVPASPNHVLRTTWHSTYIGTGQPKPAKPSRWFRDQLNRSVKMSGGPIVAVVDTGITTHPNLRVRSVGRATEALTDPASKVYGHGTFVAGLIASECPEADIRMLRAGFASRDSNWFGLVTDVELAKTIDTALAKVRNIDVLNLSIGGYTHDGRSLFATGRSVAKAIRLGVTVVAGAGNDGRRDPFHPAAEPGVIAVGSLDSKGARSCFSNTGPWVDLHAIGEDVVSTYPIVEVNRMALPEGGAPGCRPQPAVPEQTVDYNTGFARWSGTSFAAARISGAIARTRVDRS